MTVIRALAILSNAQRQVAKEAREARLRGLQVENPYRRGFARYGFEQAISELADVWDRVYNAVEQQENRG